MARTNGNDLANIISSELQRYGELVEEDFEKLKRTTANEIKKEIAANSPKKTGDYAKGWSVKTVRERNGTTLVVHNKTKYQVAHLLEKGHVKRNGGRVEGKPHIAPAEQKGVSKFVDSVERMIRK